MNVMFIGDIIGDHGVNIVCDVLPSLKERYEISTIIANGENASLSGFGLSEKSATKLFSSGVNLITLGNHAYANKDVVKLITEKYKIVEPLNARKRIGDGYNLYKTENGIALITQLVGKDVFQDSHDPFESFDNLLQTLSGQHKYSSIYVDFHSYDTYLKNLFAKKYSGLITAVFGTHSHVATIDYRITEEGTAFQTDVGCVGDQYAISGFQLRNSAKKLSEITDSDLLPSKNNSIFQSTLIRVDETGKSTHIQPIIVSIDTGEEIWMKANRFYEN